MVFSGDEVVDGDQGAGCAVSSGLGWTEPRIRGHIVGCFLAFLLRTVLERRLFEQREVDASFTEVLDALHQIQEVDLEIKEIPLKLVTEPPALARQVFQTLGIRPPARLQKLG